MLGLTAFPSALDVGDARRRRSTLIAACVAVVGFSFQQTAPIPAFPTIELALGAPARWTTWLLTGYLIVAAVSAPLFGKLGDRRGKRRMLLEVLGVYLLGSVGAALAPDIWALIAFRALQGVGGAVFPLCIGILRDELRDEDVGRGIGSLSGAFGFGAMLSFAAAGALTQAVSWRLIFAAGAGTVLVSIGAVLALVPDSPRRTDRSLDLPGMAILGAALAAGLIAITEGPVWGWTAPTTLALFALAAAVFAVGVRHELRADEPLVDLSAFASRPVVLANAATFASGFAVFGLYVLIPHLVQAPAHLPPAVAHRIDYGFGAGVVETGFFLVPQALGLTIAGPLAGVAARRGRGRIALGGGMALIAAAAAWLALDSSAEAGVAAALFCAGLGWGAVIGSSGTVVARGVDASQTGIATGLNSDLRLIGGGIGGQTAAALMTAFAVAPQAPSAHAFTVAFWTIAGGALAGAVCGALAPA